MRSRRGSGPYSASSTGSLDKAVGRILLFPLIFAFMAEPHVSLVDVLAIPGTTSLREMPRGPPHGFELRRTEQRNSERKGSCLFSLIQVSRATLYLPGNISLYIIPAEYGLSHSLSYDI